MLLQFTLTQEETDVLAKISGGDLDYAEVIFHQMLAEGLTAREYQFDRKRKKATRDLSFLEKTLPTREDLQAERVAYLK